MPQESCRPPAVIRVCAVVILFIILLAQGVVGVQYIKYINCPGQPFIPIYLMVMAGSILLFFLKNWNRICFFVVSFFYLIWFIAGNVCIYILYNSFEWNCNHTLYLFAFWSNNFTYVLLAVIFCSYKCQQKEPDTDAQTPVPV